jgi:hypothetical protein
LKTEPTAERTNLSTLPCPAQIVAAIRDGGRGPIAAHGFEVNLDWWNGHLKSLDLPGNQMVVGKRDGAVVFEGKARIERQDLFALADNACATPEGALSLLWHALAWGTGTGARNNLRRLRSVAADIDTAGELIRLAAERSREDAEAAYSILCPAPRPPTIKFLGPSFATKVLYAAGAGHSEHPCLIMDERVAAVLHDQVGWDSLGKQNWPGNTYARYCVLLHRWSDELHGQGQAIRADELERALFELGD